MRIIILSIFIIICFHSQAQFNNSVSLGLLNTLSNMDSKETGFIDRGFGVDIGYKRFFNNFYLSINHIRYSIGMKNEFENELIENELSQFFSDYYVIIDGSCHHIVNDTLTSTVLNDITIRNRLFLLGTGYDFTFNKFHIRPELSFGTAKINKWFQVDVFMKELNSNNIETIQYLPNPASLNFTTCGSINVEYRFNDLGFSFGGGIRFINTVINYTITEESSGNDPITRTMKVMNSRFDSFFEFGIHSYFNIKE